MNVKILGPGCTRCHQLEQTAREVLKELGIEANIEEIKDIKKIMAYPILRACEEMRFSVFSG